MGDAETLYAAERARREAMVAADVETLSALMCERFHYAHINGLVDDRSQYLDRIATKQVLYTHSRAREMKADMREGYAMLTGISEIGYAGPGGSAPGAIETLFLSVWEPTPTGWRIAAYASTPLPD
jgi:hypothetical protein